MPGADADHDDVALAAARAEAELAPRRRRWRRSRPRPEAGALLDPLSQRLLAPGQVGREQDAGAVASTKPAAPMPTAPTSSTWRGQLEDHLGERRSVATGSSDGVFRAGPGRRPSRPRRRAPPATLVPPMSTPMASATYVAPRRTECAQPMSMCSTGDSEREPPCRRRSSSTESSRPSTAAETFPRASSSSWASSPVPEQADHAAERAHAALRRAGVAGTRRTVGMPVGVVAEPAGQLVLERVESRRPPRRDPAGSDDGLIGRPAPGRARSGPAAGRRRSAAPRRPGSGAAPRAARSPGAGARR